MPTFVNVSMLKYTIMSDILNVQELHVWLWDTRSTSIQHTLIRYNIIKNSYIFTAVLASTSSFMLHSSACRGLSF